MKKKLSLLMLVSTLLISLSGLVMAITQDPKSNAIGDSANTASTFVLRDASSNFAAGTITFQLPVVSTLTLQSTAYPAGTPILVLEDSLSTGIAYATGDLYNLGVSTANNQASCVYIAVSTNISTAKAGAACSN